MTGTLHEPVDLTHAKEQEVMDWLAAAKQKEWACYFRGSHIVAASISQCNNASLLLRLADETGTLYPKYAPAKVRLFQRWHNNRFDYLVMRGELPLLAVVRER